MGDEHVQVPPVRYYEALARARQGAGALITTGDGRIIMIDTTYRDFYEIPGGAVEHGETPAQACARECREELHRDFEVGRLLAIDHQCDPGVQGDSVMYIYDGGSIDPQVLSGRGSDAEVAAVVAVTPEDLDSVTIPRLVDRIRGALTARATGAVYEAENGRPRR
ncbi:NUDIX domain-containing protein [Mycolicibacterium iranicum]|uniref:NUDIX hydrolase n=1 Tax=Mycolicibacterium iranicum TaxID=912594 RepID=A0ABT4HME4_MYCIR|nr:NUDIX hydrolase [Mycolicibacterium iranicum]MCZ0730919.1 NUDIX hydrolase [Mycolicibacterium iranicum]